jgi:Glycosyltransferase family 87
MRRIVRENGLCALGAAGASVAMAWIGLYGFGWSDYEVEALPSLNALTQGHMLEFLRLAPAYGGSLIERAPFALVPGLWGGGELAVYRMVALPCLLAAVVLGVWLCARMHAMRMAVLWRAIAVGVCVANPITLSALEQGHPEELLGACLCAGAVLAAMRGRAVWAGIFLGLAIANKEWALLAAGPVWLALAPAKNGKPRELGRSRRDWRTWPAIVCAATAAIVAGLTLAPLMLVPGGGFAATTGSVVSSHNEIFQPWQVWWFFGWHGSTVHGLFNVALPGYRHGPAWVNLVSHPLVVVVSFALAGAVWLQRLVRERGDNAGTEGTADPTRRGRDAVLLLALVFLLRCVFDSWDIGYYLLPCSIAMVVWESIGERRAPVLTVAALIAPWVLLEQLAERGLGPDAQSALFLAWTLPLSAYLALALYAPGVGIHLPARMRARAGARQEITVSSVGSPVSTS